MSQQIRIITYVVVLALVLLVAWAGAPNVDYTPRGLLLPSSDTVYAAITPEQVTVSNDPITSGTTVGTIHVEMYAPTVTDDKVRATEMYALQLAAQNGADHITLAGIFRNPEDKTINLYGKAIRR